MSEYLHIDKNGIETRLTNLSTYHLKNIIKWIERKAIEGYTVRSGGGTTAQDIWYDEDIYFGEQALKLMNHDKYVDELKRRIENIK